MTNHVHLLLRPRQTCLAPFMRRLLTGYAIYFNLRHKRSGHLFQNRYKSIVCDEDTYLLELVRYIHLNPLRAGLVTDLTALDDCPWSGHAVIMGQGVLPGQSVDDLLRLFARREGEGRRRYRQFVADGVEQGKRDDLTSSGKRRLENPDDPYDDRILGGGDFVEDLRGRRGLAAELPSRLGIAELIAKVCDRFTVDSALLREKSRAVGVAEVRGLVSYLATRYLGHSGAAVGRQLGLSRSGVSMAVRRGELLIKNDPALLSLID